MKVAIRKVATKAAAFPALALVAAGHVMAQDTVDPGVEAINGLGSKAGLYIAAAFTVAVLVAGGFWGIRMMKKSFGAAK